MKLVGRHTKKNIQETSQNNMRIGLLVYGDINTISGGYLYDRKIIEYLRSIGDEVLVISIKKTSYFKSLISNSIPRELENIQLDILIQDELVHPSFWLINQQLKKQLKCPVVSLVHLFNSARPVGTYQQVLYGFVEKSYLRTVDALILNSNETLKQANRLLNKKDLPNIIAVPCGDNFPEMENVKRSYDHSRLKILFVGNITQQKGLHVLIKAMHKLGENISLSIVGRDDLDLRYIRSIKKYISIKGLGNRINFYGPLTGEALRKKYLEHDVFVLPSVNEAYGIVFLEAMQFALPVIACVAGGAKEIIKENISGYLIEPEDNQRLVEIIVMLNNDRSLLKKISESAQQTYLLHPRWEDSGKKIKYFLQSLIEVRGKLIGQ